MEARAGHPVGDPAPAQVGQPEMFARAAVLTSVTVPSRLLERKAMERRAIEEEERR